jgi:hypothetical protein
MKSKFVKLIEIIVSNSMLILILYYILLLPHALRLVSDTHVLEFNNDLHDLGGSDQSNLVGNKHSDTILVE